MIQAENNNVSLTEFSNFTGLFMEDVNTRYGGRYKQTTNGFPFLLLNYSQTSQYGHFSNTDTSIFWLYYGQFPMSGDKILMYFL